jgi:hypothetical protein
LKFGEIVVIQGDYKILWLEFVKTLFICFNSSISAHTPCCGSFEKEKQRTFRVNEVICLGVFSKSKCLYIILAYCK